MDRGVNRGAERSHKGFKEVKRCTHPSKRNRGESARVRTRRGTRKQLGFHLTGRKQQFIPGEKNSPDSSLLLNLPCAALVIRPLSEKTKNSFPTTGRRLMKAK